MRDCSFISVFFWYLSVDSFAAMALSVRQSHDLMARNDFQPGYPAETGQGVSTYRSPTARTVVHFEIFLTS